MNALSIIMLCSIISTLTTSGMQEDTPAIHISIQPTSPVPCNSFLKRQARVYSSIADKSFNTAMTTCATGAGACLIYHLIPDLSSYTLSVAHASFASGLVACGGFSAALIASWTCIKLDSYMQQAPDTDKVVKDFLRAKNGHRLHKKYFTQTQLTKAATYHINHDGTKLVITMPHKIRKRRT